MEILRIENICKSFGTKKVLRDVSFAVEEQSIFGFIGRNGAGKTTTMKLILGLLKADSGTITVCNEPVQYGETRTNRFVGYLPDVPEFYPYMRAREYLKLCGEIAGLSGKELKTRIDELLQLVGLGEEKGRIGGYSRGMKQRLGIAQALIGRPRLLICDEPVSTEQYAIGFKKGNEELRDKVQDGLLKLVVDGTFEELAAKYELSDMVILKKGEVDNGQDPDDDTVYDENQPIGEQ
jgi:ABC-type Na+ transport system ATPase subunit NatA